LSKNIQIPQSLFCDIIRLLFYLDGEDISDTSRLICHRIDIAIADKLERLKRHDAFSAYKSAPTGFDREQARREYLKLAGITKGFISSSEIPYDSL
jgi:hypothetical protein